MFLYLKLPDGFLPTEDQGRIQAVVQMPPGATQARTEAVLEQAERIIRREPAVANTTSMVGYSDYGSGQNTGQSLIELKDWDQRDISAQALSDRLNLAFSQIKDGEVSSYLPPSVPGLGHSDGFVFRLEDRGTAAGNALGAGHALRGGGIQGLSVVFADDEYLVH